ncbi:hypothetical protein ACYJ1Y_05635 [Natrialbaceae archaeon A-gly3]
MKSPHLQSTTEPEPATIDQPITTPPARTPTDRAPQTFDRGNRERLQNLIDDCNAAFVDPETN